MIELLIAGFLLQAPDPCHAVPAPRPRPAGCTRWETTDRLVGTYSYIDAAPVRRTGDTFEIQFRTVLRQTSDNGVRSTVHLYRYDCRARTVRLVRDTDYDAAGVRLQMNAATNDGAFIASPPRGSRHANLLRRHCR